MQISNGALRARSNVGKWRYFCRENWEMKSAIITCRDMGGINVKSVTFVS